MTTQKSFLAGVMLMPERGTPEADFACALFAVLERNADLGITTDRESGLTVLFGQDEYQLDAAVGGLRDLCAFEIAAGAPHAVLRETLGHAVAVRHVHKQVRPPEFAVVSFIFEPGLQDSGFVFEDATAPDTLPAEFTAAARRGIAAQSVTGPFAGFALTDFKARLVDGKYHEIDTTPRVFEIAARAALRDGRVRDATVMMHPQMRLDVVTPEDFIGGVIGDLNSRGVSYNVSTELNGRIRIEGTAPLTNLFFYRRTLDSMSQTRAKCRIAFDRYVPVESASPPPRFPPAAAMRVA
jgi:elongation factor G